jgi:hypothetical protein
VIEINDGQLLNSEPPANAKLILVNEAGTDFLRLPWSVMESLIATAAGLFLDRVVVEVDEPYTHVLDDGKVMFMASMKPELASELQISETPGEGDLMFSRHFEAEEQYGSLALVFGKSGGKNVYFEQITSLTRIVLFTLKTN